MSRKRREEFSPGRMGLLTSREAALDISPGRQPWEKCRFARSSPERAADILPPLWGLHSRVFRTQGLRPGLMSNAASRPGLLSHAASRLEGLMLPTPRCG